jgi:hypothetical protein
MVKIPQFEVTVVSPLTALPLLSLTSCTTALSQLDVFEN